MKKIYSLLFLLFFFTLQAQIINIPDPNFKAKLLEASPSNNIAKDVNGNNVVIDLNGDNEIQVGEALNIYYLNLFSVVYIENLTGLEEFINLVDLDFTNNMVSDVDLSALTNLRKLKCSNNELSTLDVSILLNLEHLSCGSNEMTNVVLPNSTNLKYLDLKINWLDELDLTNIENLEYLNVRTNDLSFLDVGNLPNLKYLEFSHTNISSIDLSNLENLETLSCFSTEISNLDLTNNSNLKELTFGHTSVSNIDLSNLHNLESLNCGGNDLESLDISNLPELKFLRCEENNLSQIDMSHNVNLRIFRGYENQFTDLDFSNNPHLQLNEFEFYGNPLQSINIKNGSNHVTLFNIYSDLYDIYSDNGESPYVCLDESDLEDFPGGPENVPDWLFYNTYCSYSPGGTNNIIEGNALFDSNNNGNCEVGSEFINSHLKLNISDGTETGHTFANNEGEYTFYVPEGNFTLTPEIIENPDYFTISPANANLNFPLLDGSTQTQNFCISPNGNHPDVEIIFSPLEPARPGFEASYRLVYRNKGNQTVTGTINLEYAEDKLDFLNSTVTPDNQSSGLLNYNFSNLNPFEIRTIELSFEVNAPTDTPPVNIGDNLPFSAQIDIDEDENPDDNSFELNQEVVGSFDPNDIACLQGESVAPEMIGKELHYRIRFENTGNFPAERVVVAMPINPEDYEVSSFQLLNTSHEVQARVVDNTAEFFFEEIDLGPNEEGDILFSIKSLESLQIGDSVMSYADIYFDYNYPITTNEAVTTFEIMRTKEVELSSVSIFPNPATTQFMIQSDYKINSVEIYDVAGRLIQVSKLNSNQSSQNISQLPKGMYILKIQTEKGLVSYKLIKK